MLKISCQTSGFFWKEWSRSPTFLMKISGWTPLFFLEALLDSTPPEDVGLPYMTDGRHSPDTLFLVAENDFRFFREHCVSDRDWMAEVDAFVESHLQGPEIVDSWGQLRPSWPPESEDIIPSSDDELGGGSERVEPVAHRSVEEVQSSGMSFWGFSKAGKFMDKEAYQTEELCDLVRIATVAHRKGKGDLIWYSWVGAKSRRTMPSYGSNLVGVSQEGAFKLMAGIQKVKKPHHFDIWLRNQCCDAGEDLQASYVLPAIGGFDEHISGCDPTNTGVEGGVRPCSWDDYWRLEGVRIERRDLKHKSRNVCDFRPQKSGRDWGIPVKFDDDDPAGWWKTMQPPSKYWEGDETWQNILWKRGWLDSWGWLQIPEWLQKPRHSWSWRQLQMEPDAHPWNPQEGVRSPITHLAEFVVIWHEDDLFSVKGHGTRGKRVMRDHLQRYKRRFFVAHAEEARLTKTT